MPIVPNPRQNARPPRLSPEAPAEDGLPADAVLTIDDLVVYLKLPKSTAYKLAQGGTIPAQTVLRGIAVSPGRVTGPARVILRATEDEHVRPGEILVAPFTDPGWTPCFVTAAGIVMDIGRLLSHGSIVAREYGIPAVVNVAHATTTIRTGQMIEVDGTRGWSSFSKRSPVRPRTTSECE